jgi:hypothetical protein
VGIKRNSMAQSKQFKLSAEEIIPLVDNGGGCVATDKITVEGLLVGYMYREEPDFEADSGWRFFAGVEDQDFVDNPDNLAIYKVNTIANYDNAIIPYLKFPIGTELIRIKDSDKFQLIAD